ncbi:2TM domain-containing protein [Altibacter sp. HG106]|uniref:2TM domain-containing protein n=1 Tax=Altibacter sp. HG106 TaxID=3023937 RepID=UPI00234FC775|nr:2TM domain-containing protein [Altibacter sp. HG106]MDC7994581.1 2TM domain-containing protein [Altibacter sp. HG106]
MASKTNKSARIDAEQREQYEYARRRIKQKKRLMQHFIIFLAGAVLFIILNPVLGVGEDFLIADWYIWAILIWAFILIIHVFNVFLMNKFMDKEWENRQLEKLKAKQEQRIAELEAEVQKDQAPDVQLPTEEEVKKKEHPNLLPPDVE